MLGNVLPGALLLSAGQLGVLIAHGKSFSPGRIIIIVTIIIRPHGSSKNTRENERSFLREVQQDTVHGRSLRTTPGKFGSAGNEVQALACAIEALVG